MSEGSEVSSVNDVLNHLVETKPKVDGALKMLAELASDMKNYGDDISLEQINSLRQRCKEFISIKILADNLHDALEETKENITDGVEIDMVEDFENRFRNRKANTTASMNNLILASREYQSFERLLKSLFKTNEPNRASSEDDDDDDEHAGEDDEVQFAQDDQTFKDPFTQMPIVLGVRNKHCNHVYERDVIISLLKKNKRKRKAMKCPYVGCSNSIPIDEKDFLEM